MRFTVDRNIRILCLLALLIMRGVDDVSAEIPVQWSVSFTAQASSRSLAPYMLGSWNEGRYFEGNGLWQEANIYKLPDMSKRFEWSAGAGYIVGIGSKTDYARWNEDGKSWVTHPVGRNAFRITELYGELKYRACFLTIGMKALPSGIVNGSLSSGDLVRSSNATPVPGIGVGFLDFVDIPFTKGWVQINGELMYGKMMDSRFKQREFNRYSGLEAIDILYNYKRCYFRTNPDKKFHITVGMQAAAFFGGSMYEYQKGKVVATDDRGFHIKDLLQAFFPREGGEAYYEGGHLGSWDFKAIYKLRDGSILSAYFEWPWEDGSGIGRMNGWDGLWGLQYDFSRQGVVSKIVMEYLDFTNQGGPIHYAPADHPASSMTGHASGSDDYYNNGFYGAYTNYGMGIGSPFLVAPIYNRDGMLSYLHNRARGFHMALEGYPTERLSYRIMAGYAVAGGSGWFPAYRKSCSTSAMVECRIAPVRRLQGLEMGVKVAFDKGALRGDNFGVQLQMTYHGNFGIK